MGDKVVGPKKIECYLDCVSPYSYYAFSYLGQNRDKLAALGVELDFIPVFLGGINVGSGNKPPWTLPAKGAYSHYDGKRAQKYFGKSFTVPKFFPILSLLPQRALTYVKQIYPTPQYEALFDACFDTMWNSHIDISTPPNLRLAVEKVFTDTTDIDKILASGNDPTIKKKLSEMTEHAWKDLGAFGSPWFWVHDGKGNEEPFFGSDRFHFMWEYLDLPHVDFQLLVDSNGDGNGGGGGSSLKDAKAKL